MGKNPPSEGQRRQATEKPPKDPGRPSPRRKCSRRHAARRCPRHEPRGKRESEPGEHPPCSGWPRRRRKQNTARWAGCRGLGDPPLSDAGGNEKGAATVKLHLAVPRRSDPGCPVTQRLPAALRPPGDGTGASDGGMGAAGRGGAARGAGQAGDRDAGGHSGLPPCDRVQPQKGGDCRPPRQRGRAPKSYSTRKEPGTQACPRCEPCDEAGRPSRGARGGGSWGATSFSE